MHIACQYGEGPTKAIQDRVYEEDKHEAPIQGSIGRMQNDGVVIPDLMLIVKTGRLPQFRAPRAVSINNGPWFVGKDVAQVLGYQNPSKAIRDHVDDEDKLTERIVLSGQNREVIFINESGLYSLILSSKLSGANNKMGG